MNTLRTLLFASLLAALAGCGDTAPPPVETPAETPAPTPEAPALDPDVARAAPVARAIKGDPANAAAALTAAGMSSDDFESLMFAIASDSAKSQAFATAMQ